MDRGEVTSLILLDLSAAFDTVDHPILLTRLQNWFGLEGLSLDWFSSYLSLRSQAVSINDSISAFSTLSCGVPKVPYLAHSFSLSIQLLLARWSQKIPSNIICTLMTPSCTSLSLLQIRLYLLKHHHFQWHSLLDELEQTASQSLKNWISSHWHKTTTSQIFWSNKLISQQWYHPIQFLCSQSWLHLWLWHVFLWSNQLCIQILSFSFPRHPSNSSSSSSLYSHSSCKFTCLQQTWLLQFTLLWHLTNKSQQTSTHSKFIGT